MSKRQPRTSKAKIQERPMRTPSREESEADDIEIVERPESPTISSSAKKPAVRPNPKRRAKINFYGTQTSRIKNPDENMDKIATRSASGINKRRFVPDNGEDSNSNEELETPSKKKHVEGYDNISSPRIDLSTLTREPKKKSTSLVRISTQATRESEEMTPVTKGKGKYKAKPTFVLEAREEDQSEKAKFSDDWDEKEMNIAFKKSRNNDYHDNQMGGSSKADNLDKGFSDDPFVHDMSENVMPTLQKSKKVYLEDYENFTVKTLPRVDESFFKKVQDPKLHRQYPGLPALRVGYLLSWSTDSPDVAHIPYSQWPSVIPDMDIGKDSLLMFFITMIKEGRYFNPSRASPMDFYVRDGYRGRREPFLNKRPAIAISTGYCTDSNLIRGKFNKKSIAILYHGQEWERYCCFVNMIFDEKRMLAQVYNSALTFSTLPESISAPPKFQNASLSPLSGRKAHINDNAIERERGALYFSDIVPVFDARESAQDICIEFDKLDEILPRFDGEVSIGSCVAVGHSISSYAGKKDDGERLGAKAHLGTNVLFVVLLGTPIA